MKINQLLFIALSICIISCTNSQPDSIKQDIAALQQQNDSLKHENDKLKEQLNVCIYGDPNKDIQQIGRWSDNRPGSENHILTIFKNLKTGKFYIKDEFSDGSSNVEEARPLNHKGLKRYEPINNIHNEYCIVEKNGDLSMWSQNGLFAIFPNF